MNARRVQTGTTTRTMYRIYEVDEDSGRRYAERYFGESESLETVERWAQSLSDRTRIYAATITETVEFVKELRKL